MTSMTEDSTTSGQAPAARRPRRWRRLLLAVAGAWALLLATQAPALADTYPWSAWKKCVVNNGSDKQVRVQWHVYATGAAAAVKPHSVEWKTNAPGIPLKPVKEFIVDFGPSASAGEGRYRPATVEAANAWPVTESTFTGILTSRSPSVLVVLEDKGLSEICRVTVAY